ncbi:hypothetical protein MiSe_35300 [Microseira wollei NIES-4236]|uniref:Uncharacterized protein n=1 Tax=Microseira wollei NIES-4236 TaxID=2530354 RepID=A0AAV3XDM1_9CYAN|nr:hypothetical protein MiSe_35300 [Microseira wollei NIES-4236]
MRYTDSGVRAPLMLPLHKGSLLAVPYTKSNLLYESRLHQYHPKKRSLKANSVSVKGFIVIFKLL